MIGSGILLLTLFFLPIWRITLLAPQYPKGVHMFIYINKIGGSEPGTLQNVNILNHYIGMKAIEPDSIPELTYFPMVLIGFSVLALLVALVNKKLFYQLWLGALIICLILAMYDFYLWEYDYGHNLASNAPMKFEGESFQPPLIGQKTLLNFIAKSYPHIGGYMMIASALFAFIATYLKTKYNEVKA
jgi:copper chaperone NosL